MQDEHFWGRTEPGESGTPKLTPTRELWTKIHKYIRIPIFDVVDRA